MRSTRARSITAVGVSGIGKSMENNINISMEGGYIAEQSYLDSYCKVEYSDNGRVAVIRAY